MKKNNLIKYSTFVIAISLFVLSACSTPEKENVTTDQSTRVESTESIHDTIIDFLITSAATDFNEHQPPIVIDIRNVKAGYIVSGDERTYLICGEFLAQDEKEWMPFTTIKTSGYEQYIGGDDYCQQAVFVANGGKNLDEELKNKLQEKK